jgi:hypothetical protein
MLLGLTFAIAGIAVGAASHWSGYVFGALFFLACAVGAAFLWDLWRLLAVIASIYELATCTDTELLQRLREHREQRKYREEGDAATQAGNGSTKTSPGPVDLEEVFKELASTLCTKAIMALQCCPLFLTLSALFSCTLTSAVDGAPMGLRVVSAIVAVLAGLVCVGLAVLYRVVRPLIENGLRALLDPYLELLEKKMEEEVQPLELASTTDASALVGP